MDALVVGLAPKKGASKKKNQIERAKTFINRLENQGSVHGLYKQYGMIETQTTDKNLKNINIQLLVPDGHAVCGLVL